MPALWVMRLPNDPISQMARHGNDPFPNPQISTQARADSIVQFWSISKCYWW
jgi:hypothetical protein